MLPEYPHNAEEYWQIVDAHWANLYNILVSFLPKEQLREKVYLQLVEMSLKFRKKYQYV